MLWRNAIRVRPEVISVSLLVGAFRVCADQTNLDSQLRLRSLSSLYQIGNIYLCMQVSHSPIAPVTESLHSHSIYWIILLPLLQKVLTLENDHGGYTGPIGAYAGHYGDHFFIAIPLSLD